MTGGVGRDAGPSGFLIHSKLKVMSGESEFDRCDICKTEAPIERKYYPYPVQCECHSPQHFEMVRHCKDCTPTEPETTKVIFKTSDLTEKWAHLRLQPIKPRHPQEKAEEESIWEQLERFTGSIKDEIRSNNPDQSAINFWVFKIERRVQILKEHLTKE